MAYKIKEQQILYDAKGRKTHVVLSFSTYRRIMSLLEDIEDIKAVREVEHEPTIPWDEVKRKLNKKRA